MKKQCYLHYQIGPYGGDKDVHKICIDRILSVAYGICLFLVCTGLWKFFSPTSS